MSFCSLEYLTVFVENTNAHPLLIFLTAGEFGIAADSPLTPEEMALIRRKEAEQAAYSLGASVIIMSFPDSGLSFIPLEKLVEAVMPIIREHEADGIFSFDPFVTADLIDHPDHNVAGQVARYSAMADVKYFLPESKALQKRPQLYLLTRPNEENHTLPHTAELDQRRVKYMEKHYPSQFRPEKREEWVTFFDSTIEAYERVR